MSFWLLPLVALAAVPVAPAVRLQIEPNLPCELEALLGPELLEQHVRVVGAEPDPTAYLLSVRSDDEGVEFRLDDSQNGLRGKRRLELTEDDCPAAPRAAALLVKSWLAGQFNPPVIARKAVARRELVALTAPTPERQVVTPEPEAAPGTPSVPVPQSAPELRVAIRTPPLPPVTSHPVVVMAAVGAGFAFDDTPVVTAAFGAEFVFSDPWSASLSGGFHSERRPWAWHFGPTIGVELQWLGLSVERKFALGRWGDLQPAVGARVFRLFASAFDGSQMVHSDIFLPAVAASLQWRRTLAGNLFALARFGADLRLRPQSFAGPAGLSRTVPAWGFGLELGLGWKFD